MTKGIDVGNPMLVGDGARAGPVWSGRPLAFCIVHNVGDVWPELALH